MKNSYLKSTWALSLILTLASCSGGGGGSSGGGGGGGATTPSYVKSAKLQCGTKDCLSGSSVGGLAVSSNIGALTTASYYTVELKTVFDTAKNKVAAVNNYVSLLNGMASDNGVQSCDDIPSSGTLTYAGYNVELGTGSGSVNLGNGVRTPDHSVKMTDANSVTYIAFKCGAIQFVRLVREDIGTGNRDEYAYEINTATNAIVVSWGATAAAGANALGYFKSDGTDSFSFAYFDYSNSPAGGYNHSYVGGAKPFTMAATGFVKPASENFEFAYSYGNTAQPATGVDSVTWGEVVGSPLPISYRGCVSLYRTGSPMLADRSCSYDGSTAGTDTIKNFTAAAVTAAPMGNAGGFTVTDAQNLTIPNPAAL